MDKSFDAASAEARIYAKWEEAGCFRAGAKARPGAEPYSIMIPPPNVTGVSCIVGHAFNSTLQVVLIRWHRMARGSTIALGTWATDHAGHRHAKWWWSGETCTKEGKTRTSQLTREEIPVPQVWPWKCEIRPHDRSSSSASARPCGSGRARPFPPMSGAEGPSGGQEGNFNTTVIQGLRCDMYDNGVHRNRGKRLVNLGPRHSETPIFRFSSRYQEHRYRGDSLLHFIVSR